MPSRNYRTQIRFLPQFLSEVAAIVRFSGSKDRLSELSIRGAAKISSNGHAEVMIADARAISSVPDELTSAEAAPLLCAGITTYNALRKAGLRGGDLVAVQGIGGLGHLGIQFCAAHGIPYRRNRAWAQQGKACERLWRARLHRYYRRGSEWCWSHKDGVA
jgi:NADPH:quinone reductase-like Zn-dependent oxidoreductase